MGREEFPRRNVWRQFTGKLLSFILWKEEAAVRILSEKLYHRRRGNPLAFVYHCVHQQLKNTATSGAKASMSWPQSVNLKPKLEPLSSQSHHPLVPAEKWCPLWRWPHLGFGTLLPFLQLFSPLSYSLPIGPGPLLQMSRWKQRPGYFWFRFRHLFWP